MNYYYPHYLPYFWFIVWSYVIISGFLLDPTSLSVLFLDSPLKYITCIFYTLFGQDGTLLALRAKSMLEHEKTNFYFTISLFGILLMSIVFILSITFFTDELPQIHPQRLLTSVETIII